MSITTIPTSADDPINARILAVSEDRLQGFYPDPISEIARQSDLELPVVIKRIQAMLRAGTIRRVRQTLLATNLAQGALVAWQVPQDKLDAAFHYLFEQDPFSGHVVIRSTDAVTPGPNYNLWTTLKIPQGYSLTKHCDFLSRQTGAQRFRIMPAKMGFALGVAHIRRRTIAPGDKADVPAQAQPIAIVELSELEQKILDPLKREFKPEEITENLWQPRADAVGLSLEKFCEAAEGMARRKIIGRFSTFLEHAKPLADGSRITRFNALFHWAVPPGREMEAGREVGRHYIMTHAYWREAGPEFRNVNIMGVAHGMEKATVLAHKAAIDEHLKSVGIPITYTNVFWGNRSEIKPSEFSAIAYVKWCKQVGLDPEKMKEL